MLGAGAVTVKFTPLLATPPTVTMTLPVVAPLGTGTVILVPLQLVGVPEVPLNVTVLVPCVAPKFVPVIVTEVPTVPDVGLSVDMASADLGTAEVPPPLPPCEHPCSMVATANRAERAIRRLREMVLARKVMLEALPRGRQG